MSYGLPELHRLPDQFLSDARRVITRLHIPGGPDRIRRIVDRVTGLDESSAAAELHAIVHDFTSRHRNIEAALDDHYRHICKETGLDDSLSPDKRRLIGAYFTMEYSIEAAALFNPSIVPHFEQSGLAEGACRFIMSLRATGEGHISSIVFRTGVVDPTGRVLFDAPSRYASGGKPDPNALRSKPRFLAKLVEMGNHNSIAGELLDRLDEDFSLADLQCVIDEYRPSELAEAQFHETAEDMIWLAKSNYTLRFPTNSATSEIVIFPVTENESRGIEDARFVRFVDDDGTVTYYGTYTAYNGFHILPQLLITQDFRNFRISTLSGSRVQNKGMALFPRKVNGKYMMIGRLDGENLFVMSSHDIRFWNNADLLRTPQHSWEFIQIGNCGSPIETDEGWILLTHGVGPMRRYCISAALLDLDDPSRLIAHLDEPLIAPDDREREGYVPNVVYSCGAMIHNKTLIIPYAMSDSATTLATIPVDALLSHLLKR